MCPCKLRSVSGTPYPPTPPPPFLSCTNTARSPCSSLARCFGVPTYCSLFISLRRRLHAKSSAFLHAIYKQGRAEHSDIMFFSIRFSHVNPRPQIDSTCLSLPCHHAFAAIQHPFAPFRSRKLPLTSCSSFAVGTQTNHEGFTDKAYTTNYRESKADLGAGWKRGPTFLCSLHGGESPGYEEREEMSDRGVNRTRGGTAGESQPCGCA